MSWSTNSEYLYEQVSRVPSDRAALRTEEVDQGKYNQAERAAYEREHGDSQIHGQKTHERAALTKRRRGCDSESCRWPPRASAQPPHVSFLTIGQRISYVRARSKDSRSVAFSASVEFIDTLVDERNSSARSANHDFAGVRPENETCQLTFICGSSVHELG